MNNKSPKVLLIGNGLNRLLDENRGKEYISWESLIGKLVQEGKKKDYEQVNGLASNITVASAMCILNDKERLDKLVSLISEQPKIENPILKQLLEIPFDAILTTNYSYEIEENIDINFDYRKNHKCNKGEMQEKKYTIRSYNQVNNNKISHNVWHIHGEIGRRSSIIFNHNDYGNLLWKIRQYTSEKKDKDNYFSSWIDYMLYGEVYCVGLKFDFSEFDLWWLLTRRQRNKEGYNEQKLYLYRPFSKSEVKNTVLLENLGVEVSDLNMKIINKEKFDYEYFYKLVIKDIKKKLKGR